MGLAGMVCLLCSVTYGFFLAVKVVYSVLGGWGIVGGLVLAPVVFGIAPWYALFVLGDSYPLLIVYGATLCSVAVMLAGGALGLMSGKHGREKRN